MRIHAIITLICLAIIAGCGGGGSNEAPTLPRPAVSATVISKNVNLVARQVISGSDATGTANATLRIDPNDNSIEGSVTLNGVDADAVTLNTGFAGETGPAIVHFEKVNDSEWSAPVSAALTSSEVDVLRIGGTYLQATTTDAPDGALRGQVRGADQSYHLQFVTLSGFQVMPVVTTAATASAALSLNGTTAVIHLNGPVLDDAVSVHIHHSHAGTNGPVVAELVADPGNSAHWFIEDLILDGDTFSALNESMLYLDVHTSSQPDGAVRGQIAVSAFVSLLTLDGGDVVPSVNTSSSGIVAITGEFDDDWDWDPRVTMHVNLPGLDDATGVTIHRAAIGQNGPLIHTLTGDPNDQSHWLIEGARLEEQETQGFYIQVTSPGFPAAELRAQIETRNSWWRDSSSFVVTSVTPSDGATRAVLPSAIEVIFNNDLQTDSVTLDRVALIASGGDGYFRDGNELAIVPIAVAANGNRMSIDLTGTQFQDDTYQLTLDGSSSTPIRSINNQRLDGEFSGSPSQRSDFISTFQVDAAHPAPPGLQQLQDEILTPGCALSGCHSGPRPPLGLDLSQNQTYQSAVNVPATLDPNLRLIEPYDPENSFLIRNAHAPGMPQLSNSSMQLLREWVADGAQNN